MLLVWAAAAITASVVFCGIRIYNRLVTARNDVRNGWSQIDVQLKRRYDLVPALVSAVRGYMEHERELLEKVTLARSRAMGAGRLRERADAEEGLSESLGSLFMVFENYPAIRSNDNVMHLQEELVSTENRIAFSRQHYNDLVANYITMLEVFPDRIIASMFLFRPSEFFRSVSAERQPPNAAVR